MAKNHANNDKKKQSVLSEPTAEELSEFAYLPTKITGLNEKKPFGSTSYKYMKGLLMQRDSSIKPKVSRLNVEKVVNPPRMPVETNNKGSLELGNAAGKSTDITPIKKEPTKLMTKVARGKAPVEIPPKT